MLPNLRTLGINGHTRYPRWVSIGIPVTHAGYKWSYRYSRWVSMILPVTHTGYQWSYPLPMLGISGQTRYPCWASVVIPVIQAGYQWSHPLPKLGINGNTRYPRWVSIVIPESAESSHTQILKCMSRDQFVLFVKIVWQLSCSTMCSCQSFNEPHTTTIRRERCSY